ncbi:MULTISPECIES: hypothetical protein [unclassified Actinopolyspora]|uniref:hypothetical protein n=1 Tax=unclassified Actinopolyspora TaxID=2639451 RepID=UPI0013F64232|nr:MULTISPECIES: hypothetical protein [unclassified Actinopolyspora]NHD16454.1 hypothetical protein [Actinopolyspora sp. BKK2]NHE75683.1 hypothetical protein [Actinopolyspora sp. BKK1]
MTRFPDGRGHASVTALAFRVALLLGMLLAFWLAAQWWNADRADAASAFPGAEGSTPTAEETESDPLVEPIAIRSGDTAEQVAARISGTEAEKPPEPAAVDVDPIVKPLELAVDSPDAAEPVSASRDESTGGTPPEGCDSSRELAPDGESAREAAATPGSPGSPGTAGLATAGSTTSDGTRLQEQETERTATPDRDDGPRAAAVPAASEVQRDSGASLPSRGGPARTLETGPDTSGSTAALAAEEKSEQPPEHPRPTPLPAPVKAPSTAQVVQPNAGSGQRDVHALHPEPLRLPTLTEARSEQEHEGLRSGVKAAVPVTTPD